MSTATDELVEIDVDLDAPVLCKANDACENVATYLGTCACAARHTLPCCTPCYEPLEAALAKIRGIPAWVLHFELGYGWKCATCDETLSDPFITWRPL